MKNAEKPAYPTEIAFHEGKPLESNQISQNTGIFPGLTKRELIAAMVMQGIVAHSVNYMAADYREAAKDAIACADELLKQLES